MAQAVTVGCANRCRAESVLARSDPCAGSVECAVCVWHSSVSGWKDDAAAFSGRPRSGWCQRNSGGRTECYRFRL